MEVGGKPEKVCVEVSEATEFDGIARAARVSITLHTGMVGGDVCYW